MPPIFAAPFLSVKQAQSLFEDINKEGGGAGDDTQTQQEPYKSSLTDESILSLTDSWKKTYQIYYSDIEKSQEIAYSYWIGKQQMNTQEAIEGRMLVDNIIFESLETFLPIATRANPDPLVSSDNSPEGQKLVYSVKNMLVYQANQQSLRLILKDAARGWALNRLGCIGMSYDVDTDDIKTEAIDVKKMIFDKDGYIMPNGVFSGEYIGRRKKKTASKLMEMFPSKKVDIIAACNGKTATKLTFIEWWYQNTDVFFTLETKGDSVVLGKFKNPHWNYDGEEKRVNADTGMEEVSVIKGRNHLKKPRAPFVFLGIFSTHTAPHDDTSLILQNVGVQDLVNKRYRQIDKNIDRQNNGMVVSSVFTAEQAAMAASALRNGSAIRVPEGSVRDAVAFPQVPPLAPNVYQNLQDARGELRNIFGTAGSTPQGQASEDTARGKILVNQMDSSRIGGGVTEYIEKVAASVYDYWVQMMYVHYDEAHYASAIGTQGAQEVIQLRNTDFNRTITITVKEGSLIPHDPLTERNEAVDLWSANAIDPITLYTKLDFPDPYNAAKSLLVWQMIAKGALPPQMMFPDFPQGAPAVAVPGSGGGTGTNAVNSPTGPDIGQTVPPPASAGAQDIQSEQLMGAVKV